jgi:hypothetical protein
LLKYQKAPPATTINTANTIPTFLSISRVFTNVSESAVVHPYRFNFYLLLAEFQKKEVMRMVMLKGSGFSDLRSHFLIMSLFAVLYNLLAVRSYKKTSA